MTHYQVALKATVTEDVTVEADSWQEAIQLAQQSSKLTRFSYASPLATTWRNALVTPLKTREELTSALTVGGH